MTSSKKGLGMGRKWKTKDMLLAFVLLIPTFYVLFRTFIFPIVQSLMWSFFHYNLLDRSPVTFIGMKNYTDILKDPDFWMSMYYTTYFTVISTAVELVFGLFSALLLNQVFKGRVLFRVIIIIPWAMLTLVNGLLWKWIYQPGYGALNVALHHLHLLAPGQDPLWLAGAQQVINSVIVADVWKMTPYMTLLLLAGLQAIPTDLYEAAIIDGAGFWKKLFYITIPQLKSMLIIAIVLRIIGAFRVYDILTVFTGDPTTSVSYLTFNYAFRYFYLGKASAMAWISTVFVLIFIVLYIRLLKKNEETI
jgi:ABC-type sugar transport system permease subunit